MYTILTRFAGTLTDSRRAALVLVCSLALSGCFEIKGKHVVNHHGDSDNGSYTLSLPTVLYEATIKEDPSAFTVLARYSRPSIIHRDGRTYVSDTSGNASMEHAYDTVTCADTSGQPGWSDCVFSKKKDGIQLPGWTVDWEVALHREMKVLRSNHHRTIVRSGISHLIWYFDGTQVNAFDITFTVRVPNSQSAGKSPSEEQPSQPKFFMIGFDR